MMKLTKTILKRMMWMARGTATMVGLAVMVAVVLGVGTTALAAVPGDPFKLGKLNTINTISQLVGSTNNALLRINNNNAGAKATALDLQVEAGKAPLKVNSGVKVAKLNADKVDGKNASAFLWAGAKATDADLLDGKDSTDFASSSIFAEVLGNGNLFTLNSSHAVSSRHISTGIYEATFDRAVDNGCIHLAQALDREAFTITTAGPRYLPSGTPLRERKVRVDQFDHAGNRVDGAVVVDVVCR